MMIPNRVLAALLIFLWVVTLGCRGGVGRMAEKLDRPTALALLKEKEDELLINVARQHTWYVSPVVLEATVYKPIPGGFGSTPEEEEARLIANMHGELAQRNALVDVGLLKRQADKDTQETTPVTGYEKFTRYVYYFSVVAQPGVSFSQATEGCRSTECRGNASFALAKPAFTSVTGVLLRGIEAEVEAQVTYGPTTLFARLLDAEKKMQEKLKPGDLRYLPPLQNYWASVHSIQVVGTETRQCQFRRYDDGWRLVPLGR
jgi:hypothetical protein